ncbi:MAG: hypothetical protein H7099_20490 [Gemmatimonadaceae bacterium]|nr:hypothetical protein [Gemmatimonadaceae bacterium]
MIIPIVSLYPVIAVVALALTHTPAPHRASSDAAATVARSTEVHRIRAHFDSVLSELPARDLGSWSSAQQSRRTALLTTLRGYRDAGAFPHNYDFPGQPAPYFIDRKTGVLCAVAHLLASTGRRDIVDRVAASDNNVYVAQLASDTAFVQWLHANGLTLTEAARIQVPYFYPSPDVAGPKDNGAAYTVGSAVAISGSIVASLWTTRGNTDGHRNLSNFAGLAASAVSLGVGIAAAGDNTSPRAAAPLSLIAGGVTAYLSTRGMLRHRAYRTAQREAANRPRVAGATLSPILPIAGVSGAGVAMRIVF